MDKIFRIRTSNHFKLGALVLTIPISLIATIYFFFYEHDLILGTIVFTFTFGFSIIPTLFIHAQYYKYNKGKVLLVNKELEQVVYKSSKLIKSQYRFSDIKKIVFYTPYNLKSGGGLMPLAFMGYYYAVIFTVDGKEFIVTCLMSPDVGDLHHSFTDIKIENQYRFYPMITTKK